MKKSLISLLFITMTASCSYLKGSLDQLASQDQPDEKSNRTEKKDSSVIEDDNDGFDIIELKQAKMWTRIEKLEAKMREQRQRIQLLEHGLNFGIAPTPVDLTSQWLSAPPDSHNNLDMALDDSQSLAAITAPPMKSKKMPTPSPSGSNDEARFDEKMSQAQQLYHASRYGKALVAFTKISQEFSVSIRQGHPTYWIGRCWFKLGEFHSATSKFNEVLTEFSALPIAPAAKLFLARAEIKLGLNGKATTHLEELIRDHRDESFADAARNIITTMENKL